MPTKVTAISSPPHSVIGPTLPSTARQLVSTAGSTPMRRSISSGIETTLDA